MNTYTVTVRTNSGLLTYDTIGTDSAGVHMAAIDKFGACGVTVKPTRDLPCVS